MKLLLVSLIFCLNLVRAETLTGKFTDSDDSRIELPFDIATDGNVKFTFRHDTFIDSFREYWRFAIRPKDSGEEIRVFSLKGNVVSASVFEGLAAGEYVMKVQSSSVFSTDPFEVEIEPVQSSNLTEIWPNESRKVANPLPLNTQIEGNRSSSTDLDYYAFTTPSSGIVELRFSRSDFVESSANLWRIQIFPALEGDAVDMFTLKGDEASGKSIVGLPAGDYIAKVSPPANDLNEQYFLEIAFSATEFTEKEPNDDRISANEIALNNPYTGKIDSDENFDFYRFENTNSGPVTLSITQPSVTASTTTRWLVSVYPENSTTQVVTFSLKFGEKEKSITETLPAGKYAVRIQGSQSQEEIYTFKVSGSGGFLPEVLQAKIRDSNEISWLSETGKIYSIEASSDAENWRKVREGILGTGGTMREHFAKETSFKFLRIVKTSP